MPDTDIRSLVTKAFYAWSQGIASITDIFADDLRWEIVGHSAASKRYTSKQQFIDEVLAPFGRRFKPDDPFRPVAIRGIYVDGDTAIVLWDGRGRTINDTTYDNTYAWIMTFRDGLVIDATAFYDSISFNELWTNVVPAPPTG